jgi:hypothetical protein
MSDKALQIIGCDIGTGGDQCAPGFRSTTATLLNKEGAFNSNGGSRSRALRGEKSAGALAAPARRRRQEQDLRHLWPCRLLRRTPAFKAAFG